jgi:hypothetical protein
LGLRLQNGLVLNDLYSIGVYWVKRILLPQRHASGMAPMRQAKAFAPDSKLQG